MKTVSVSGSSDSTRESEESEEPDYRHDDVTSTASSSRYPLGFHLQPVTTGGKDSAKRAACRKPDDGPAHGDGQLWRHYADADAWPPPSTWLCSTSSPSRRRSARRAKADGSAIAEALLTPLACIKSQRCSSHVPSSPARFPALQGARALVRRRASLEPPPIARETTPHPRLHFHKLGDAPVAPGAATESLIG
ncbi:hypothetical protein HPB50_024969 [Hyalomma asiaticum]|uniref:Uncharacterized protein n=1 Tax=Hyalomma asiaticum TaxID=266040 RepID=A0ACB7TSZ4_HYAAI|nr:hypothetical protein HPB50_024969 [Hyalomma asiaticum]